MGFFSSPTFGLVSCTPFLKLYSKALVLLMVIMPLLLVCRGESRALVKEWSMANEEHLEILKKGVAVWNQWRKDNSEIIPNLKGANLNKASLARANLSKADLTKANLAGANFFTAVLSEAILYKAELSKAIFAGAVLRKANLGSSSLVKADFGLANLSAADLSWAYLMEANLIDANLRQANLSHADLDGADLSKADLTKANLAGAYLDGTVFRGTTTWSTLFLDVDLRKTKGIAEVDHKGPSTLGIDTIYRSGGNIPESFLIGCGVPDDFITYMRSLTGKAIEYYSAFISYCSQDEGFARRLHVDLQDYGVRCWFAPENLKIGEKIRDGIDESIRIHDKLLLILSKHSLASDWVEHEVETAFAKEREQGRTVLFPIRLDNAVMDSKTGWAAHIRRTRNIGNFTEWRNYERYQKALARLLRDLKAENAQN